MRGRTREKNLNLLKLFIFSQRNYTLNYPAQRKCSFYSPQRSGEATVEVDNESVNILAPLSFQHLCWRGDRCLEFSPTRARFCGAPLYTRP